MPYKNSLFKDLKGRRLTAYQSAFIRALKSPAGTVHILYAGKYNRSKGVPYPSTGMPLKGESIEHSPRLAAGNVLPVTAVLSSTVRMKVDFQCTVKSTASRDNWQPINALA